MQVAQLPLLCAITLSTNTNIFTAFTGLLSFTLVILPFLTFSHCCYLKYGLVFSFSCAKLQLNCYTSNTSCADMMSPCKTCSSLAGRRDQKLISPASSSGEVFLSDTSPLSSPYSTGASTSVSPPFSGNLKHSRSWSAFPPQGHKPRSSRGLSSVEEIGKWADAEIKRLSSASHEQAKFYTRTRPSKDSRELSSPKITGETFPKAKEQHHSPRKSESRAQEATLMKNRIPQTQTKIQPASVRRSPQAGQQVTSTRQSAEHQQGIQRRLNDSAGKEKLVHEKKNGEGANLEIRTHKQAGGKEGRGERTSLSREQESLKRRVTGQSHQHRTLPNTVREKGTSKELENRNLNGKGKPTDDSNTSKGTINTKESVSFKEKWSRRGSVALPRAERGREEERQFSYSKDKSSKEGFVASMNSIPAALQTQKGPISPGPWRVPSSARILSQEEVLRDALGLEY